MKAAIYARVSTAGQDVTRQLVECREYCDRAGWPVAQEFVDAGVSGTREHRKQLDALFALCRSRRFRVIVVHSFDRFSRSLRQLVLSLDELRDLGVGFVSVSESIDLTTPAGQFMYHVLAAFAEFERRIISERVRSGLRQARRAGKVLGRPSTTRGAVPLQVLSRRRSGESWSTIAREMNLSRSAAQRAAAKAAACQ